MANFRTLTRYTNGSIFKDRQERDFLVLRLPLKLEPADGDQYVTITQRFLDKLIISVFLLKQHFKSGPICY